jgi:hypothetical protein
LHVSTSAENVATFASTDTAARIVITDGTDTGYVNVSSGKVSLGQTLGLSANNLNIDSLGNLLVGGTTSPSGSGQIVANGGVYLGGTGSANLLDDYEEGSWTPTIIAGTTNPTVTYGSSTSGQYVKIGKVIMLKCDIDVDAISGGSGNAIINGVPFNSSGFPAWDAGVFRDADAIKINGQIFRLTGWVGNGVFYITYVGSSTGHCGDANLSISSIGTGRIQFTTWFTV